MKQTSTPNITKEQIFCDDCQKFYPIKPDSFTYLEWHWTLMCCFNCNKILARIIRKTTKRVVTKEL